MRGPPVAVGVAVATAVLARFGDAAGQRHDARAQWISARLNPPRRARLHRGHPTILVMSARVDLR